MNDMKEVRAIGLVLVAAMGLTAHAAPQWEVLPIFGGGYVQGVALCPSDSQRLYTYVDVGGPYRSDDAGRTWRPLHGNMSVEMRERGFDEVRSMSVDPRNADSVVILGGASGDAPGGFAVTRDGGESWRVTGDACAYGNGPRRMEGFCLSRNPFDPDELVGGEDRSGLFVSRDNGESWTRTGPTNVWYTDVRHDVTVTGRVYASSPQIPTNALAKYWCAGASCRTPRQFGFFRSDDGARTWRRLSDESPSEIAQIPGDGRLVGLFGHQYVKVSADGGASWMPFEEGLYVSAERRTEPWAGGNYYALGAGRDFWLVGDGNGNKYRRGKDDAAWTRLPSGLMYAGDPENEPRLEGRKPEDVRMTALMTLAADPKDDRHWFTTDWFDLWETGDAGNSWTSRVSGIMQLVSYDLSFDPLSADNFCCCLYDMGAFLTFDGGRSFHRATYPEDAAGRRFPNNIVAARYSAKTSGFVLAAGARGWDVGLWRSHDAGRSWAPLDGKGLPPLKPDAHVVSTIVEDRDGSFLVTVSGKPVSGEGGIYRSRDQGENWTWEGRGLASVKGFDFGFNPSQGCWPRLALSADGSAVTGGHRGNWELLSRDSKTGTWKPNGLHWPDWRRYPLAADPHTPGRFLRGGPGDAVESTDGGKTWHVFEPLRGQTCRSFAFDETTPGLVAFGCRDGVFVSFDGGHAIRKLTAGLDAPSGSSRTLKLDRGRLFFLTSGSGVYRFTRSLTSGDDAALPQGAFWYNTSKCTP